MSGRLLKAIFSFALLSAPALLPVVVFCFALRHLGEWMIVADAPPRKLNVIFTFGGENAREIYSAGLLARDSGACWISSDNRTGRRDYLARKGVDTARVILVTTCASTHEEAGFLAAWLRANSAWYGPEPLAVGLVSGPYHMRRISMEIRYHANDINARFYYLPVPLEIYGHTIGTYRDWWKIPPMRRLVFFELKKIFYSGFVHHPLLPHQWEQHHECP
jgi:hypothetical protein